LVKAYKGVFIFTLHFTVNSFIEFLQPYLISNQDGYSCIKTLKDFI